MISLNEMARAVNRSLVHIAMLQRRFGLPSFPGATYPAAYLEFIRVVVTLRTFNISEESLRDLWRLEKKLLELLHVDSNGSRTWFLDACGQKTHRRRRLLLSNYNLGMDLTAPGLQLGLNFADRPAELFAGKEMGEDALRVLRESLKLRDRIIAEIASELPRARAAVNWVAPLAGPSKPKTTARRRQPKTDPN